MALFAGHGSAHGTHGLPVRDGLKWTIKSTARTVRDPVTEMIWEQHLEGERPLGIVPVRDDSTCRWGSIDVDKYDVNLLEIIAKVEQLKLPLVPCRSKSGGLHLFLFLTEGVPASQVQSTLRDWAALLGQAGCEIFPKQTQILTDKGDVGNWMVMPYYGDTFGGKLKEQVGLKKTGSEMTIDEFLSLAEKSSISEETLGTLANSRTRQKNGHRVLSGAEPPSHVNDFSDGPVCLQNLISEGGVERGGQSNALLMMGIYYKRAYPADWESKLEAANRDFLSPPGSAEGLVSVLKSLRRKDYEYTCKTEPMCSHCNATVCRTRQFGVGTGGNVPVINSISKLNSDPVMWFVDVEGVRVECTTDQLQNYILFQKLCIDRVGKSYAPIKMGDWFSILNVALASAVELPVPDDVRPGGKFHELIEEFLTNRARGVVRTDILSGRPWEDEEERRYYFRLRDLEKYLDREGVKGFNRSKVMLLIKEMQGDKKELNIKGKNVRCWYVPSDSVEPPVELDLPPDKASPI